MDFLNNEGVGQILASMNLRLDGLGAQVQTDWTATSGMGQILNKPFGTIPANATVQVLLTPTAAGGNITSRALTTSSFAAASITSTNIPTVQAIGATRGAVNGLAGLDANGKVPLAQISDAILGQMLYAGTFVPGTAVATLTANAQTFLGTTNATITLTNNTTATTGYQANQGNYYIASANGTFAGLTFVLGDWLVSNKTAWAKIDNTDAVIDWTNKKNPKRVSFAIALTGEVCIEDNNPESSTYGEMIPAITSTIEST